MQNSATVNLTPEDFMIATVKASMRQLMAIKNQRVGFDHGGASQRKLAARLGNSVIGELGEIAASRALRLPITSEFENTAASDMLGEIEIRATEWSNGHLVVNLNEPNHKRFVLVTIDYLKAVVVGWIPGHQAKQLKYFRSGDPDCYFVPQSDLYGLQSLHIER